MLGHFEVRNGYTCAPTRDEAWLSSTATRRYDRRPRGSARAGCAHMAKFCFRRHPTSVSYALLHGASLVPEDITWNSEPQHLPHVLRISGGPGDGFHWAPFSFFSMKQVQAFELRPQSLSLLRDRSVVHDGDPAKNKTAKPNAWNTRWHRALALPWACFLACAHTTLTNLASGSSNKHHVARRPVNVHLLQPGLPARLRITSSISDTRVLMKIRMVCLAPDILSRKRR